MERGTSVAKLSLIFFLEDVRTMRGGNPGHYDGKKTGASSQTLQMKHPLPGPKRFQGLRKGLYYGNPICRAKLVKHVLKWLERGQQPAKIAERLGLSVRVVLQLADRESPPVDLRPRLVKKS